MGKGPIRIIEGEKDGDKTFLVLVWDPDVLSPENYAKLVTALGDVVRAEGGMGVERVQSIIQKSAHYVEPVRIDKRFDWSLGTTIRLCRRKKLPHYIMPNGEIRLIESEVEALVRHIQANDQGVSTSGIDEGIPD